jgi:hypothetical protein
MISPQPFSASDRSTLQSAATASGFDIRVSPWTAPADERTRRVVSATTIEELHQAAADPDFDFSPPTDARPFFFNMLKLRGVLSGAPPPAGGGIIAGNLVATSTLMALLGIAGVLVLAIIGWPLMALSRPERATRPFLWGLAYFALIGGGFMFLQIPFLQRFSVYLGHPTYTFSIILFLMIVAAGGGSFYSERLGLERLPPLQALPLGIAGLIALEALLLPAALERTVGWALPGRTATVAAFIVPLAAALGLCFPIGMRLIGRHSSQVTAWMWGVNGACGVLASILAVMVSLWLGIQTNLWIAALLYGLLALPIRALGAGGAGVRRPG